MGELDVLVREDPSFHFHDRRALALEALDEVCGSNLGLEHVATGENVHSSIGILGPRMNREVRFRDHDHTADSKGTEFMEGDIYDGGLCLSCCGDQGISDFLKALENCGTAILQLDQKMGT